MFTVLATFGGLEVNKMAVSSSLCRLDGRNERSWEGRANNQLWIQRAPRIVFTVVESWRVVIGLWFADQICSVRRV